MEAEARGLNPINKNPRVRPRLKLILPGFLKELTGVVEIWRKYRLARRENFPGALLKISRYGFCAGACNSRNPIIKDILESVRMRHDVCLDIIPG